MDKTQLRKIIREEVQRSINEAPRFNLKFPVEIEDLTMKFLYLGMQNGVNKLLDDVEKRTGSNTNPISLQILESWAEVEKQLKKKMNMIGQDALRYFFSVGSKHFNSDAPFIRNIFKKYRLSQRDFR